MTRPPALPDSRLREWIRASLHGSASPPAGRLSAELAVLEEMLAAIHLAPIDPATEPVLRFDPAALEQRDEAHE